MSRRRQDRRGPVGAPRRGPGADLDASRSLDGIASAVVPAAALLPIRFFFGITFLYAGFDKLLDPTFFDPASAASIQAQMTAFADSSPIGALARLSEPLAVPIGLAIAIAEIAIGLGALSGLAFRLAAAGGAMLSLLFWLTASWAVRPYYYGPDLPYAVGWLALALAGTGGLLVPGPLRPRPMIVERRDRGNALAPSAPGLTRRVVLQAALLAGAAVVVASLAVPLRWLGVDLGGGTRASSRPSPSPSPGAATMPPTGAPVASVADVDRRGTASFTVPFDAPAPLPAGDPGIIVRLADGTYVAYDAVCTHAGCTVQWDAADDVIYCPCHGAVFDAANDGAVLRGPARQPLATLPLVVDPSTGQILLST